MAGKRKVVVESEAFSALLAEVKVRIAAAQTRAVFAVNTELVQLYWDIGRILGERQRQHGWGAGVLPRLALRLQNELPDLKGFSERNLDRMLAFCRAYPSPADFSPPVVAKMDRAKKGSRTPGRGHGSASDSLLWRVPWVHHVMLLEKEKDATVRLWYMQQILAHGWSRSVLALQSDAPTIGMILCQSQDRLLAEYSFQGIDKPIGISTYELTRALPARLRSALPTVEEIEAELAPKRRRR